MKRILTLLSLLTFAFGADAQVIINEYSCANVNTINDAYNQKEDWVELLNTSGAPVSLSGFYLSDDKFQPAKWQIPAGVTINANSKMMVFCSNRGTFFGGQLHPTFKLTQTKGEYFVLANSTGAIVDSVHLFVTQVNHSYGRITDASGQWGIFQTPTPNAANANPFSSYAPKPIFSVAPGFYAAAQSVSLSSPASNVAIHYTTDGSVPTLSSPVYAAPIAVNNTIVIRAAAFSSDPMVLPSFTETNTYFINENNTMNVISVSGNYTYLINGFGGAGNAAGFPTAIEFFNKNHQFVFELDGTWRKHGHDSWAYDQRGFRLYAKDQYGSDWAMKHKFFNASSRDTFQQIILKAGASDNYPGNSGHPSCHLRDAFAHTLSNKFNLDLDQRLYEPTLVFVNGQYWGVYEIREKVDADYMEYYYGQTKKKVDHLSYWGGLQVREGSDTGWVNLYNYIIANPMTVPANYDHVTSFLNVKSFIEYFILNTWLVNTDWLNWNTMWWRGRKGQGVKWRYALWDMDNILDLGQNYTGVGTPTYQNSPCNPFNLFQNNSSIKHTDMLVRLLQNPDFTKLYRSTFIDMLNGPLNCANMIPHFDSITSIIQPEMQRHITRWGGSYATWQNNIQYMRNQILGRCQVIAQKLDSCMDLNPQEIAFNVFPANGGTIQMNGNTVSPYVWSRIVEADTVINLNATPVNSYYFFDHWEKYKVANTFTPDSLTQAVGFDFKTKDSVVAFFRYFNPDSINVTFNVYPPNSGTIALNANPLPSYPFTIKLDRKYANSLMAVPAAGSDFKFVNWNKKRSNTLLDPSAFNSDVLMNFQEGDTLTAFFETSPDIPPATPDIAALDQTMTVPNAFSPNGDGRNDVFKIIQGKDIKAIELRIYNRFGNEVFYTSNAQAGWDGNYKGKEAPLGVYYYVLTAYFNNSFQTAHKMYKGEILLVR